MADMQGQQCDTRPVRLLRMAVCRFVHALSGEDDGSDDVETKAESDAVQAAAKLEDESGIRDTELEDAVSKEQGKFANSDTDSCTPKLFLALLSALKKLTEDSKRDAAVATSKSFLQKGKRDAAVATSKSFLQKVLFNKVKSFTPYSSH